MNADIDPVAEANDEVSLERLWHLRRSLEVAFVLSFIVLVFGLTLHRSGYDVYLDAGLGRIIASGGLSEVREFLPDSRPDAPLTGWLWQLIVAPVMAVGSTSAVGMLASALVAAGYAVVLAVLGRRMNRVLAGLLLVMSVYVARPNFTPSGQALGIFLMGAMTVLCVNALDSKSRRFWWTVPLMVMWVNADFSWVCGAALAVGFMPMVAFGNTPRKAEKALALLAVLAGTLASPEFTGVYSALLRLPLEAGSAESWISPALVGADATVLYTGLFVALVIAFVAGSRAAAALAIAGLVAALFGISRTAMPLVAFALFAALAFGVPGLILQIVSSTPEPKRSGLRFWLLGILVDGEGNAGLPGAGRLSNDALREEEGGESAVPFIPEDPVRKRKMYGSGTLLAGAGLLGLLALFAWTAAGSRTYVFGGGVDEEEMPAKAVAFACEAGLTGSAYVHSKWAGYLMWEAYPEVRPTYDPRPLAATAESAEAAAMPFAMGQGREALQLAEDLHARGMRFAIVPQNWPRAIEMRPFWTPVHWDDTGAVFMPNVAGNSAFIKANDRRLTYPGYFGIGLSAEILPAVVKELEAHIERDPDSAIAEYELGMCRFYEKKYDEAAYHFVIALGNDVTLAQAYHSLGDIVRTTRSESIHQVVLSALAKDPAMAEVVWSLSGVGGEEKFDAAAMALYSRAIEFDPGFAMAYLRRGNLFMQTGNWQHGLTNLIKAREADDMRRQLDLARPGLRAELDRQIAAMVSTLSGGGRTGPPPADALPGGEEEGRDTATLDSTDAGLVGGE